jgi:hypothetical protein
MAVTVTAQRRKRRVLTKKGRKPRITKKAGRYQMVNQMGGTKSKGQRVYEAAGEAKRIALESAKYVGRQIGKFGSWSKKRLGFGKSGEVPIAAEGTTEVYYNPVFVPVSQNNRSERKHNPIVERVSNLSDISRGYYKGPLGGSSLAKLKNAFTWKRNPNKPSHLSVYQEKKQAAINKAIQDATNHDTKYTLLFKTLSSGKRIINNNKKTSQSELLKKPYIKSYTNYLTSVRNKITSSIPESILSGDLKIVPSESGAPQLLISEKDFINLKNIGLLSSETSINDRGRVYGKKQPNVGSIRLRPDEIKRIYNYLQPQTLSDYADAFHKLSNRIVGKKNEIIELNREAQTIALSTEYIGMLKDKGIVLPNSNNYETKQKNGQIKVYFNYNPKDLHKLLLEKSIANVKKQVNDQQMQWTQHARRVQPVTAVEENPYETS